MDGVTLEEKGIKFANKEFSKAAERLYYYNAKLSGIREIVQATLHIETKDASKPLICLDGLAKSGLASVQWKKALGKSAHVIVSSKYSAAVKQTCDLNGIQHSDWVLDPDHVTGQYPIREQGDNEVLVSPFPPQTVLRQEACNFVYMHCIQSATFYTDSVFSNIRPQGVACFLTSSITSQCVRSPQLIQRQYSAHVQKTEYVKEMALRILIADLARSAARYQRGIDVLYSCFVEDHFLVTVRVSKNSQSAVDTAESCGRVLHCLMCEERVLWPQVNTPIENPYSLLPCACKASNPGKTALILGPMWLGGILNVDYLEQLSKKCSELNVSEKMLALLSSLIVEGVCSSLATCSRDAQTFSEKNTNAKEKLSNSDVEIASSQTSKENMKSGSKMDLTSSCEGISPTVENNSKGIQIDNAEDAVMEKVVDEPTTYASDSECHGQNNSKTNSNNKSAGLNSSSNQISVDGDLSEPAAKRQKLGDNHSKLSSNGNKPCAGCHSNSNEGIQKKSGPPMLFYYDVQQKKYTGYPKLTKLVSLLQQGGYRASRTHFEAYGIRTSATIRQMEAVIQKYKLTKS